MSISSYQTSQERVLSSRVIRNDTRDARGVFSTRNCGQFRFSEANRPINQKHLERLYDAVSAKNLLDKYPIIVTPEMIVIDGQHRLKVAEALQTPIYYVVADNMSVSDIAAINDVTLKWKNEDYLHYWISMGNEDYRKIGEFAKKYHQITFSWIAQTVSMASGEVTKWADTFRSGQADATRLEKAEKIILAAKDFKPYLGKRWTSKTFLGAVNVLLLSPGYSHETMMARLEYQSTKLVPCVSIDAYLELLSSIYNYRTRIENRINFAKYRYQQQRKTHKRRTGFG